MDEYLYIPTVAGTVNWKGRVLVFFAGALHVKGCSHYPNYNVRTETPLFTRETIVSTI